MRPGGRLVLIGNVTASTVSLPLGLVIIKGLEIIGSDSVSSSELAATFEFMDAKGIRPHISSVLPLEEVSSSSGSFALSMASQRRSMRVCVTALRSSHMSRDPVHACCVCVCPRFGTAPLVPGQAKAAHNSLLTRQVQGRIILQLKESW